MMSELEDKLNIALTNIETSKQIIENTIQQTEDYTLVKHKLQLLDIKIKLKEVINRISGVAL